MLGHLHIYRFIASPCFYIIWYTNYRRRREKLLQISSIIILGKKKTDLDFSTIKVNVFNYVG